MKKIIFIILFIFSVPSLKSQIKKINKSQTVELGKTDNVALARNDNTYYLAYQDVNSGNLNIYRSFEFKNLNNDIEILKSTINQGFRILPETDIILELPNDIILLHYESIRGKNYLQIIQYINKKQTFIGKSNYISEKEISIIFSRI